MDERTMQLSVRQFSKIESGPLLNGFPVRLEVRIHKEIRDYQERLFFGLIQQTGRGRRDNSVLVPWGKTVSPLHPAPFGNTHGIPRWHQIHTARTDGIFVLGDETTARKTIRR